MARRKNSVTRVHVVLDVTLTVADDWIIDTSGKDVALRSGENFFLLSKEHLGSVLQAKAHDDPPFEVRSSAVAEVYTYDD